MRGPLNIKLYIFVYHFFGCLPYGIARLKFDAYVFLTILIGNECTLSLVLICNCNSWSTDRRENKVVGRRQLDPTNSISPLRPLSSSSCLQWNLFSFREFLRVSRCIVTVAHFYVQSILHLCDHWAEFVFQYAALDNVQIMSTDLIKMPFTTRWVCMFT